MLIDVGEIQIQRKKRKASTSNLFSIRIKKNVYFEIMKCVFKCSMINCLIDKTYLSLFSIFQSHFLLRSFPFRILINKTKQKQKKISFHDVRLGIGFQALYFYLIENKNN
jgi:hypothetical protein